MKKINRIIIGVIGAYLAILLAAGIILPGKAAGNSREYLVEVNEVMQGMEEAGGFFMPDLHTMEYIEYVSFLEGKNVVDAGEAEAFFRKRNGCETSVRPLIINGRLLGLIRLDYRSRTDTGNVFLTAAGLILLSGLFTVGILVFIRNRLVNPFIKLSSMPYELSKGRLETEIEETKDRYFGKFAWGIAMLRDNLKSARRKALKLEKEKKLLLLSVSHDIKTPLNSIKLYAKALEEGVYDSEEKRVKAAEHIQNLAGEIDDFVKEIVKSSSEEIVHIQVENSEFYLKELADMIQEYYAPKCSLMMTELVIGTYENKLLKGSRDSAFEAVENIMENAFKYGDGRSIHITFYEEEYCQLIKIRNTGQPVRAEEMPHLFDSFFRGSNTAEKEGNGLGLYICREIMRKMEGDIFACREDGGMSFQLVFRY